MNQSLTVSTALAANTLRPEAIPQPSCSICLMPSPVTPCAECSKWCTRCYGYTEIHDNHSRPYDPREQISMACPACNGSGLRPNGPTFNDWPPEERLCF